jgi:hypothetical protein
LCRLDRAGSVGILATELGASEFHECGRSGSMNPQSQGLHADHSGRPIARWNSRPALPGGPFRPRRPGAGRKPAAACVDHNGTGAVGTIRRATRRAATEDGGGEQEGRRAAWLLGNRSSRGRGMTRHQNNPDNRHPGASVKREADDDQACIRNRDLGIRPARLRARCRMDASTTRRRIDDRQRPERGSGRDRLRSARHGCRSHRGVTDSPRQPEGVKLEERAPH